MSTHFFSHRRTFPRNGTAEHDTRDDSTGRAACALYTQKADNQSHRLLQQSCPLQSGRPSGFATGLFPGQQMGRRHISSTVAVAELRLHRLQVPRRSSAISPDRSTFGRKWAGMSSRRYAVPAGALRRTRIRCRRSQGKGERKKIREEALKPKREPLTGTGRAAFWARSSPVCRACQRSSLW